MSARIWRLFREGVDAFIRDEALTRGAAIAFYIVTAIAPILYITVTLAGLVMGNAAAQDAVSHVLGRIMSRDGTALVELAIHNARGTSTSIVGGVIGIILLVVTASGVFGEMEDALNAIWQAPRKGAVIPRLLRGRAISLVLADRGWDPSRDFDVDHERPYRLEPLHHDRHALQPVFAGAVERMSHSCRAAVLFAAIYKILPNLYPSNGVTLSRAPSAWRRCFRWWQLLLGYVLGSMGLAKACRRGRRSHAAPALWVYYSAQVFLLGAEFTKVHACQYGSHQGCEAAAEPQPVPPARLAAWRQSGGPAPKPDWCLTLGMNAACASLSASERRGLNGSGRTRATRTSREMAEISSAGVSRRCF